MASQDVCIPNYGINLVRFRMDFMKECHLCRSVEGIVTLIRPTLLVSNFIVLKIAFRKVIGTVRFNFLITNWAPIITRATPRIDPTLNTRTAIVVKIGHAFPFLIWLAIYM
jgi:hypothetical protein